MTIQTVILVLPLLLDCKNGPLYKKSSNKKKKTYILLKKEKLETFIPVRGAITRTMQVQNLYNGFKNYSDSLSTQLKDPRSY